MDVIETEIVDTKNHTNKFLTYGFAILWLAATTYIFLLKDEYPNTYLSILSFIVYLIGLYLLFKITFLKPKVLGKLKISDEYLEINYGNDQKKLDFSFIKQLKLLYSGYAKWTMNVWGSRNFLEIESEDGQTFAFEILIKSENQKNEMKKIFKSPPIKDQFKLDYLNEYTLHSF